MEGLAEKGATYTRRGTNADREAAKLKGTFDSGEVGCVYCGIETTNVPNQPNSLHMDHIDPWVKTKDSSVDNLVPSCATCNLQKGVRDPVEHMDRIHLD